ncbi:MAG: sporulation protein YqfD [Clostridia bacterium]|nr:sporulation protein YqfD [Clostridia bacterium]
MKVVNLLRYIKGYIRFNAAGGFTERFINLCAGKAINIFKSSYENGAFVGETDIRNFAKLRSVARKTGVRITVKEKGGLPFFIKRKKHRAGLLLGFVFYCLFVVIMNMFVWNIDASGSNRYSDEQIIEAAEKVGVRYGICRFFFDESKAAREIYKLFDDELSWVTVNIKASSCFIEVRDSTVGSKPDNKNKEPSNLVADFDGVILSDETYSGIKNISKGSAVKKGDLLISGIMEDDYGSAVYYSAQGNFTARHMRSCGVELQTDQKVSVICSYTKKYVLHFFGLPIKIGFSLKDENTDEFVVKRFLQYGTHKLPLGVSIITCVKKEDAIISQENMSVLAADIFTAKTYDELKNTKLLSGKIVLQREKDSFNIKGEYDCIDFIGISKPIIVENIESK